MDINIQPKQSSMSASTVSAKRWGVFGIPLEGIEDLIPLEWNKKGDGGKIWVK